MCNLDCYSVSQGLCQSVIIYSCLVTVFSLGGVRPVHDLVLSPSLGVCQSVTQAHLLIHQVIVL